jgi:carotenoid cleavage dioxygenase-like enzyme
MYFLYFLFAVHSFFLVGAPTPTKAVLVQHSMNIAMATLIGGLGLKPISSGFDINCSRPMVFHIIDLNKEEYEQNITVNMKEFTSAAANNSMIVSHTINGYYETTNVLVLDVIGYDFLFFDRFMSSEINNKTARDFGVYSKKRAKTFRFRLDVNANVALTVEELLPNSDWEFPIINEGTTFGLCFGKEKCVFVLLTCCSVFFYFSDMCIGYAGFKGKPYCHAYGYEFRHEVNMEHQPSNGATGMASMAMIKYHVCQGLDKETGKRMNQKFVRPYHYFSEPWFVPRPNGTKEDDGVVLTLALDGAVGKGVLYVLNASDLDVMATMPLPVLVNLKTHGRFVWDATMN